ncbi:MAG: TonB-dependent receptor [Melioribacteraceae bacterium]|nr:TonB-dependent receptor [Melioribacteraceae bacterium]
MKKNKILILMMFVTLCFISETSFSQEKTLTTKDLFAMSLEELMDVKIVTAGKKEEKLSSVPASVYVITREEIERLGLTCYTDLLQHIPGFYMIDDYYWLGSTSFGVRGFFSTGPMNNLIILINGVNQMSDKYSDYPDVKINVPIESIERVEVIKGPMSVIYGSGAFFGAINIITHNPESDSQTKKVSVSYGTGNRKKAALKYSYKEKDLSFTVNTAYCRYEGIDIPFKDLTTKEGILNYVGLAPDATTAGQLDTERKYFSLALNHKTFFADFSISESQKDVFDAQPNLPRGSELNTKAANAVIGFNYQISEKLKGKVKLGYYSHSHTLDYEIFRPNYYEIDGQNTNSYDVEINAIYNVKKNLNFDFGLYRRTVLDIHQISDFGYYGLDYGAGEHGLPSGETYSTHAVYTQASYSPTDKIKLVAGIRLDHLDDYNIEVTRGIVTEDPADGRNPDDPDNRTIIKSKYEPKDNGFSTVTRLAAIYSPVKNHVIKLMWGQAAKQPSFTENYRQLPGGYPFLDAAKINTLELNYLFNYGTKFSANLSVFYNTINNLISSTNIYDQTTGQWDIFSYTSGKMETTGLEAGLRWQPFDIIRVEGDISYQISEDKKPGYEDIEPGYSPKLLGYFSLIYTYNKNRSITLSARYMDEMFTLWKTDTTPENGQRIGDKVDSYFVIGINFLRKNILDTDLYASLKINNLFDQEIRYPTTTSNSWANKGTVGMGRSVLFTLGYEF